MGYQLLSELILAAKAATVCVPPRIYGNVPKAIVERAYVVCERRYNGCPAVIRETGDRDYKVTCKKRPMPVSRTAELGEL